VKARDRVRIVTMPANRAAEPVAAQTPADAQTGAKA